MTSGAAGRGAGRRRNSRIVQGTPGFACRIMIGTMSRGVCMELSRIHRHRYLIEDPVRFGCLVSAAALLLVSDIPTWMTLLIVGVTQLAPVMMAARALEQGWSR